MLTGSEEMLNSYRKKAHLPQPRLTASHTSGNTVTTVQHCYKTAGSEKKEMPVSVPSSEILCKAIRELDAIKLPSS